MDDVIRRADGVEAFNGYFWPTEDWWLGHEHRGYPSRWMFGIVALADGRFSTEGFTWAIRENAGLYGSPVLFDSRAKAIRAAAARLIRCMRAARKWHRSSDALHGKRLAFAINWTLETVTRECSTPPSRKVRIEDPPRPPEATGLPLFDHYTLGSERRVSERVH